MIDLTEISGLPIKFDEIKGKLIFENDVNFSEEYPITLLEIVPILLNKSLKYPEIVYKQSTKIPLKTSQNKAIYDLLYIPSGLLGIEYIKTHIHYSQFCKGKYDCIIEVLYGEVTVIIQKNKEEEDSYEYEKNVEELIILTLTKGQKIAIPSGTFYTFVNTGLSLLILAKVAKTHTNPINYSILKKEKGLACFIISKNARVETVANPKYKVSNKIESLSLSQYLKINPKSIYVELNSSTEPLSKIEDKFVQLFNN